MTKVEWRETCTEEDYPEELWNRVCEYAMTFLEKGRPNFDVPHTLAVAKHAYLIAKEQGADIRVLVTAALLHDIGYYGLFDSNALAGLSSVMDKKARHMVVGAELARQFLVDIDDLTVQQKEEVVHLVSVHDKFRELTTLEELILMKADTLGAIDVRGGVIPTFNGPDAAKYLNGDSRERCSLFEKRLGRQDYDELVEKFIDYIKRRDGI